MNWCLPHGMIRDYRIDDRRVLFHVPTTSLFELDAAAAAVMDQLSSAESLTADAMAVRLDGRFTPPVLAEALENLAALGVIHPLAGGAPVRQPPPVPDDALTTVVLTLTTGCNLACTYCYKEDLSRPAQAQTLSFDHACRAVDLLIARSGQRPRVNLTFFGGEPLTALPMIRRVVAYAQDRGAETGKAFDFSLTTNATLLDDATIDFLAAHRFGVTVSMDGPEAVHDRNRRTGGGHGTHAVVAAKARRLLERYPGRPIGARVTLTKGVTDLAAIFRHLRDDIGFAEVGFAPVTAGLPAGFGLDAAETRQVFDGLAALALEWRDGALAGRDTGFSNISQMMTALDEGSSKLIPCGAGVALLAVETGGDIALCHRFAGSGILRFGHVDTGLDQDGLDRFVARARQRTEGFCGGCHARHLCAGGCYHESYARHGDPWRPTDHYCDLMRAWIDLGISIYAEIMAKTPTIMTRRAGSRGSTT
ncbi:Radical SAM protein [Candidatus Terasakiella magnetica]|nr:Radical SAM protein [Candidatus Terasakiella magnetica]